MQTDHMELRVAAALTSSKAVITRANLVKLLDEFDALLAATQPKRKAAAKKAVAALVGDLPAWLPLEPWEAFLAMRVKIKKPATDYAQRLLIKKLAAFMEQGYNVVDVLEQSITSGWQDLYAPKGQQFGHGKGHQPTPALPDRRERKRADANAEALARLAGIPVFDPNVIDMEGNPNA